MKIAPPEAPASGYMFGKGIYFADSFKKSYGYTNDWSVPNGSKFLLVCEVALGKMYEKTHSEYITELKRK